MNKFVVMIVIMVAGFGFMHFRYSKMAEKARHSAEVKRMRAVDAQIVRADFSPVVLQDPSVAASHAACTADRTPYLQLNLSDEQIDGFCRCVAVHTQAQIFPLLPEQCRVPGRWDFASDPACAALDKAKPHQPQDRSLEMVKICAAWVRAG